MKISVFFTGLMLSVIISLQGITQETNDFSQEILENTIKYHDPNNVWETYKGKLYQVTIHPSNYVVKETIEIDNQNDYYLSTCFQEFGILKRGIKKGNSFYSLNEKSEIPEEIKTNWSISDQGIKYFSVIHHGHFGLPMVLKNYKVELQNNVKVVDFNGRKCHALTFIGKPYSVWAGELILYVDPDNYSMRGKKYINGDYSEYTIFSGEIEINGLKVVHAKMAYNSDDLPTYTSVSYLVEE